MKRYTVIILSLPVVDQLVNASIIGADVGLCKLPYPAGGGIDGGCDNALLRTGIGSGLWQAKLDCHGLKRADCCQEKDCARRISFAAVQGIYAIDKWKVNVMVVHYVELIFIQRLQKERELQYSKIGFSVLVIGPY